MVNLTLGWLRPSGAVGTLARAAERLEPEEITPSPTIIDPVAKDFCGSVLITYEYGKIVSIEKRELA